MVQSSHYFYFFYQTLLSFVLAVSSLFRKGFHCVTSFILSLLGEIDWSKITFANFLLRLKLFMKSSLVNLRFEDFSPLVKIWHWAKHIWYSFISLLKNDSWSRFLFWLVCADCWRERQEWIFKIKIEGHVGLGFVVGLNQTSFINSHSHVSLVFFMDLWGEQEFSGGTRLNVSVHRWFFCLH